jgi:DNA-binding transcriptional LysR family regulator
VLPTFRKRHPRIDVEIVVEDRLVDIVGEGYDAGVRLTESIERDMVQVRLTDEFRFVIVGTPEYLSEHGVPRSPEDLLHHECITFRSPTTGALYAWELERRRKSWRVVEARRELARAREHLASVATTWLVRPPPLNVLAGVGPRGKVSTEDKAGLI